MRSGAGALVISLAVVAAVTAGYFGLHHDAAPGDGGGPSARAGAAIAYDPSSGDAVMFGGTGSGGQVLADTWLWNGSSWSVATPASSPPARYDAQMAWDPESQRLILLGGTGGNGCSVGSGSAGAVSGSAGTAPSAPSAASDGCTQIQDGWAWDGSDWSQIALGHGTGQLGDYTLAGASLATDPTSGKLILVTDDSPASSAIPLPAIYNSGGASSSGGVSAPAPPASSASAAGGSASGSAGSSGGVCIGVGGGPCGTPVALPSATAATAPAQTACPLEGSCEVSTCPVAPADEPTTSCPISCGTVMIACPTCPVAASPGSGVAVPAIACAMCPMTDNGSTSVCGICPATADPASPAPGSQVSCSNCPLVTCSPALAATLTWVFDGTTFQLADSSATDSPASGGELAWFPGPGLLVDLGANLDAEMGGVAIACPADAPCPLVPAAEDWQWTGSAWTPVQDLKAGTGTSYFEVPPVTDTAAGDVVGLDATGTLWVSANPATGWAKTSPASAPAPRSEPAMAYDAATGQVLLFGGELDGTTAAAGEVMGDTWTWDGSTWTEQGGNAPTTPSATPVSTSTGFPEVPPASASAVAGSPSPSASPSPSSAPSPSPSATTASPAVASQASAPAAGAVPDIATTIG